MTAKTNKNVWRLVLDLCMTALYAVLMFGPETGLLFHELAGLALGVLFALHLILNRRMFRALREKGARRGPAGSLLLCCDVLLPLAMGGLLVTGVLISRTLFSFAAGGRAASALHSVFAWAGAGVLGVHLALHLRFLAGVVRTLFRRLRDRSVVRGFASAAALLLAAAVIFGGAYKLLANSGADRTDTLSSATFEQGGPGRQGRGTPPDGSQGQSGSRPDVNSSATPDSGSGA